MAHSIRAILDGDIPFVTRVYNWAIVNSLAHFGTSLVTEDGVRADWLLGRSGFPWLLAEIGGEPAGFAKAGPFRTREAYAWTAELTVYLLPHAHGQGVGKALYVRLLEVAKAQGFRLVLGGVAQPNPASEALHRSVGMVEMGRFPASGFKFGQWIDVTFFGIEFFDSTRRPAPIRPVREVDPAYPW
jgi:phosphinothricin acetyltransferase